MAIRSSMVSCDPCDIIVGAYSAALCEAEVQQSAGVTYASGGADYAEWLERSNPKEDMIFGQIVGVKGGKISLNTDGAEQILVVSMSPVVLGNMPPENQEHLYEKVGFMGQVLVQVRGKVELGDYILPSGRNNGVGIAISPEKLKLEQMPQIIGRAWAVSTEERPVNLINVAIGLNRNDVAKIVLEQQTVLETQRQQIDALKKEMETTNETLRQLLPKFEEMNAQIRALNNPVSLPNVSNQPIEESAKKNLNLPEEYLKNEEPGKAVGTVLQIKMNEPTENLAKREMQPPVENLALEAPNQSKLTREMLLQNLEALKQNLIAQGIDVNTHPKFKQIFNDDVYRENLIKQILDRQE